MREACLFIVALGSGLVACSASKIASDAGAEGGAGASGGAGRGGASGPGAAGHTGAGGSAAGAAGIGGAAGSASARGSGGTAGDGTVGAGGAGTAGTAGSGGAAGDCAAYMTVVLSGSYRLTTTAPTVAVTSSSSSKSSWANTAQTTVQPGGPAFHLVFAVSFPGTPAVGTYDNETNGLGCMVDLDDLTGDVWDAFQGRSGDRVVTTGSCSITFTTVTPTSETLDQTSYCAHGNLAATMVGDFDPSTVMLSASF